MGWRRLGNPAFVQSGVPMGFCSTAYLVFTGPKLESPADVQEISWLAGKKIPDAGAPQPAQCPGRPSSSMFWARPSSLMSRARPGGFERPVAIARAASAIVGLSYVSRGDGLGMPRP